MQDTNKYKIAVFHAFFYEKGGGEKLVFNLRNYYNAHLYAVTVNFKKYKPDGGDSFSKELFNPKYELTYLCKDSENRVIKFIKRLFVFTLSNKIEELLNYDAVIFSGNVMFLQRRLKKLRDKSSKTGKPKFIMYCHTPPRKLTDLFKSFIANTPFLLRPFFKYGSKYVLHHYRKDVRTMELIFTNSYTTQKRITEFTGLNSIVVYSLIDVNKYKFIEQGDFYLSYARLEDTKRIPLIIDAFEKMPDKKLIICSSGPMRGWLEAELKKRNLQNVVYEGLVSDERLIELIGKCFAGIYIPINEDLGLTQLEIMSAGKPVIGVNEGGLMETIIDGKTGVMIKADPAVEDLIDAIKNLSKEKALSMKESCIAQASNFTPEIFFEKVNKELDKIIMGRKGIE